MITFNYTVKDKDGIHARPAGSLAKLAKQYKSEILIQHGTKKANAAKLIMLMGLGIKCGDTVFVTISGDDEAEAAKALKDFFADNLW